MDSPFQTYHQGISPCILVTSLPNNTETSYHLASAYLESSPPSSSRDTLPDFEILRNDYLQKLTSKITFRSSYDEPQRNDPLGVHINVNDLSVSPRFSIDDYISSPLTPDDTFDTSPVPDESNWTNRPNLQSINTLPKTPLEPDSGTAALSSEEDKRSVSSAIHYSLYSSPRLPSIQIPKTTSTKSSQMKVSNSSPTSNTALGPRSKTTLDALIPLHAPTRARKYVLPSATSPKDASGAPLDVSRLGKKRSHSAAFEESLGGDDGERTNKGRNNEPDADTCEISDTEQEKLQSKRRRSTLAARKSRRRKLEYQLALEEKVEKLQGLRDKWKTRCKVLQEILKSHEAEFNFEDEEGEED
ncbi:hypothetical protein BDP27DRAFT_184928 [Rhodocollybia butyracea]|uniref:BZIP domain-containing protein n=1 Tax=Rhodocollybia butyracea TaxID=206335 RepID=A0A9P5Q3Y5_9AGAR|nr:hypothetical protein BDP27DRAFT_184928 [Rhodocollybia butyracea]